MAISPSRTIAFEILRRVESEGAYASDLLRAALDANVKHEDAALATELTLGVLRWRRLLDFLLDRQLKKPGAKLDLPVLVALRMGLYQLRFLEKIPARATVHESVDLVKRAKKSSAATLVNAVLRRSAEHAKDTVVDLLPKKSSLAERLGILHSHPTWMVERWLARFGEERTLALLVVNNQPPRLACTLHDSTRRHVILGSLEQAGMRVESGRLLRTAFSVSGGSPARTEAFRKGWISIQDEASQAIPHLLDVQPGERVLDVCAAPGGKTPPLVRAAGNKGVVVATDRHAHRLRAMRSQFERLGFARVHLVELDAERPLPFAHDFRRILVDAPCSGTGTLARHPEIRWRLRPQQLAEFHQLQVALVARALENLASGGRLVYSTCSLEPEENERVVMDVLERAPSVRLVGRDVAARTLAPHAAPHFEVEKLFGLEGYFRTFPGDHHTDGFFAAIFEKH